MSEPESPNLQDIFQRAADLPAAAREAFVSERCGPDLTLRDQVLRMLARLELDTPAFLKAPAVGSFPSEGAHGSGAPAPEDGSSELLPGASLGPYRILGKIGEGGFGLIYAAEQRTPVHRKVAIKLLKAGMDTHQVLARFEAERNALSVMNHPGIARVLDAGESANGRPYFAMEYVQGDPITTFCDNQSLSVEDRLKLFCEVCAAVQHAHQKGVIHRDLKPSNILVSITDGRPAPKVIDFGIAKALHQPLTERTLFTQQGQLMGTPEYMSPEQAEMSGVGVDTTTDVYSLGVILYELLAGSLPFDATSLRSKGLAEVYRILREEEPPRPSTRVSTVDERTTAIGRHRGTDLRVLCRALRGDLDLVVMKAMEKQSVRRYPSASEFAADIKHYLAKEPVLACPPSAAYKLQKFIARNRVAVGFVAAMFTLLVLGIVGTTWGMLGAAAERDEADRQRGLAIEKGAEADARRLEADRLRVVAEEQRTLAKEQAEIATAEGNRARAVTDFLLDALGLADPDITQLAEMTMRAALEVAGAEVGERFADYPRSEREIRVVIGRAFQTLGEPEVAVLHLQEALRLHRAEPDADRAERARILGTLSRCQMMAGDIAWVPTTRRAQSLRLGVIRERAPKLYGALAELHGQTRNRLLIARSKESFERAISVAEETLPAGDPMWRLVVLCLHQSAMEVGWHYDGTLGGDMGERVLDLARRHQVQGAPERRSLIKNILDVRVLGGDYAGAKRLATEEITRLTEAMGPDHWYLETYRVVLAACMSAAGEYGEAEPLLRRSIDVFAEHKTSGLFDVLIAKAHLARVCDATDRPAEGARLRTEAWADAAQTWDGPISWAAVKVGYPESDPFCKAVDRFDEVLREAVRSGSALADVDPALEELAEAIVEAVKLRDEDGLSLRMASQLSSRADVSMFGARAAGLLLEEAAGYIARRASESMPGLRCGIRIQRARVFIATGRFSEAETLASSALALAAREGLDVPGGDPVGALGYAHLTRAAAVLAQGHLQDATAEFRLGLDITCGVYGPDSSEAHSTNQMVLSALAMFGGSRELALWVCGDLPRLVEAVLLSANDRNSLAWSVARVSGLDPASYLLASELARLACEEEPENAAYRNTSGVALYRAGRYEEALELLQAGLSPVDRAFEAMAYRALDDRERAGAELVELRKLMREPANQGDAELRGFAEEAEALLKSEEP